jgi:DNA-binding response OmpR family regulator
MKILIIEDDKNIVASIECTFNVGWPEVSLLSTDWGRKGIQLVDTENPDLVILDLGLPDIDGLQVIKDIRLFSDIPIVVLTVKMEETTVIRALNLGANDYIYKPFRPMELLARIKRHILFSEKRKESSVCIWGRFIFDYGRRELVQDNKKIGLSGIEAEILKVLIKNSPDVVTYSSLAKSVWGDDYEGAYDCLKVHISHLRGKIGDVQGKHKTIITKIDMGYYVVDPS